MSGKTPSKGSPDRPLTPKESFFVCEYLVDLNGTRAAIRAGYSKKTSRQIAARLLSKVNIQAEIQAALQQRRDDTLLTAYEVERELDRLIRFNIKEFIDEEGNPKDLHELSAEQAACIKELSLIETPLGLHRNLKFYDKVQAISLKMRRLGLLNDKLEVTSDYAKWLKALREKVKVLD